MEIERKYLITSKPESLDIYKFRDIEQSYISYKPEIRIRKSNNDYTLTFKHGASLVREEIELSINESKYNELKKLTISESIIKTRYEIPINVNHKYYIGEFDIYSNINGLLTIEVEFESIEDSVNFNRFKPSWFGIEITDNSKFKNQSLAQYGNPLKY